MLVFVLALIQLSLTTGLIATFGYLETTQAPATQPTDAKPCKSRRRRRRRRIG